MKISLVIAEVGVVVTSDVDNSDAERVLGNISVALEDEKKDVNVVSDNVTATLLENDTASLLCVGVDVRVNSGKEVFSEVDIKTLVSEIVAVSVTVSCVIWKRVLFGWRLEDGTCPRVVEVSSIATVDDSTAVLGENNDVEDIENGTDSTIPDAVVTVTLETSSVSSSLVLGSGVGSTSVEVGSVLKDNVSTAVVVMVVRFEVPTMIVETAEGVMVEISPSSDTLPVLDTNTVPSALVAS